MILLKVIALIGFIYFAINVVYLLVFAVAGYLYKPLVYPYRNPVLRFCVLVPAYKGDEVIINTVEQNLLQKYPEELYDIYIIADSFQPQTLEKLSQYRARVIEVQFENSTKAKSINKAFETITEKYDYVVLLDVDNVMERGFLQKLNNRLIKDVQIVQAHRIALNLDAPFAILDALSEEINNHIFRKGHVALRFSSALIGSAKAAGFTFFKDLMKDVDAIGGFDKELELRILKQRIKIHYMDDALVYDEKVRSATVFQNQRRRWLSAQFFYLRRFLLSGFVEFFRQGNIDYANKLFQFLMLPRLLLAGLLIFFTLLFAIAGFSYLQPGWFILLVLNIFTLLLSIPPKYYNKKTAHALWLLPRAFVLYFANFFRLGGANKKFIHTPHGTNKPQA